MLLLLVINILYCSIVVVDFTKVSSFKQPIFAIKNGYVGSATRFVGLCYVILLDENVTTNEITSAKMITFNKTIIEVENN